MSDIVVNRQRVQQQAIFLVQFQDRANVIQTFPWHERIGLAFDSDGRKCVRDTNHTLVFASRHKAVAV
nr:hypothetical protein [Bradyrhizobium sp. CCBAU 11386]